MYDDDEISKPSPTGLAWLFVEAVRPSTLPESYDSDSDGDGPAAAGGTAMSYDQVKAPDEPPASQLEAGESGLAV